MHFEKYILIKGLKDGLNYTTLTAEDEYFINFIEQQNKFFFAVGNVKKTGLHGSAYNFSVTYDTVDADNILDIIDIKKYLMKKLDIK